MGKKGFSAVIVIVEILLISAVVIGAYYLGTNNNKQSTQAEQVVTNPTPAISNLPVASPDETAGWKKFENSKLSIMYPPNWVIDNSFPDQFDVAFKSSDYTEDAAPNVTKGFKVYLYVNRGYGKEPSTLGQVSIEPQTWLGKKATLEKNNWEGSYTRLWTNDNADLSMHMATPVFEKPAFKTFEDNKKDFLTSANSLKIK